jgi:hypothetical protein
MVAKVLPSLTTNGSVPSNTRAPPEAKLTPVRNDTLFLLDSFNRERYGGEVGKPTFSAAQCSIHFTLKLTLRKRSNKPTRERTVCMIFNKPNL